jgi:hypothetical protein
MLRERQEVFYGTYASEVLLPDLINLNRRPESIKPDLTPIYDAEIDTSWLYGWENRMRSERKIVTESQAYMQLHQE